MDTDDLELMLRSDGLSLVGPFMPDAERGIRTTDIGLARASRATAGIKTEADLLAGHGLTDALQLEERAGVHVDAQAEQFREIHRKLLRGERNPLGGYPCLDGAADLIPGTSVQVETLGGKEPEH